MVRKGKKKEGFGYCPKDQEFVRFAKWTEKEEENTKTWTCCYKCNHTSSEIDSVLSIQDMKEKLQGIDKYTMVKGYWDFVEDCKTKTRSKLSPTHKGNKKNDLREAMVEAEADIRRKKRNFTTTMEKLDSAYSKTSKGWETASEGLDRAKRSLDSSEVPYGGKVLLGLDKVGDYLVRKAGNKLEKKAGSVEAKIEAIENMLRQDRGTYNIRITEKEIKECEVKGFDINKVKDRTAEKAKSLENTCSEVAGKVESKLKEVVNKPEIKDVVDKGRNFLKKLWD
ncbi:MAG: hypothetical protein ABIB71_05470 [Candidatus Woesearchaeota archaeon]